MTIGGSCRDLRTLNVTCSGDAGPTVGRSAQVEEMRRWYGDVRFTRIQQGSVKPEDIATSLLVVTPEPGRLDAVKQAAYTLPNPSVRVQALGGQWLGSSRARLPNWIQLFGVTGILFILVTGAVSAAAEFVRIRHVLAPLSVLTGHRRVFRSVTAWHLTVPLLVATVVTGAVTAWHSAFFIALVQEGSVSWTVLAAGITTCALVSLAVGFLGARAAAREADQWRPAAD